MESKWWEYYAVRYFVGTVIGALIIAFLNGHVDSPYHGRLTLGDGSKEVTFLGVGLVAALGFAFCYVASAPVLVLHAARAHLRWSAIKANATMSGLCVVVAITSAGVAAWSILPSTTAIAIALVLGIQAALVLLALITRFSVIESFYRSLADARSKAMRKKDEQPSPGAEYITSYRHLREHGNAFAIVVLEGVLGMALYQIQSVLSAVYFVGAWVLPATFAWILGSLLESRFAASP